MKKLFLIALAILLTIVRLFAQINPETFTPGLDIEQETNSYPLVERIDPRVGSKSDELPFDASLKKYCPKVGDQENIGSCVGWAVGYAAMTMLYAKEYTWSESELSNNAFSALYLYNNIKLYNSCDAGATLYDAGTFLKDHGNLLSSNFDYPDVNDCEKNATPVQKNQASNHKIHDFFALFDTEENAKKKIYLTKKTLAEGMPVVIGLSLLKNFAKIEGNTWNTTIGDTSSWGGHAMLVVGYDDRKQAFEVVNSWGSDWGNKGFIWIKYEDFAQYCLFAYLYYIGKEYNDPERSEDSIFLTGQFGFRIPVFSEEDISFKNIAPIHQKNGVYHLARTDWEVSDQYQLFIKGVQAKRYVYVFSIDAEGSNIHWPRNAKLNAKYIAFGSNEGPIIPYNEVEIIVPGEERALIKRVEGDDNICIVYSSVRIDDFKNRVQQVATAQGSIYERYMIGFGDITIPASQRNYAKNTMRFLSTESSDPSTEISVPIILTIEGK